MHFAFCESFLSFARLALFCWYFLVVRLRLSESAAGLFTPVDEGLFCQLVNLRLAVVHRGEIASVNIILKRQTLLSSVGRFVCFNYSNTFIARLN